MHVADEGGVAVELGKVPGAEGREERPADVVQRGVDHLIVVWDGVAGLRA
jgi:hypothetical protein